MTGTDKIQFDPKEGTTGFWGLRKFPIKEQYGNMPYYEEAIAYCKSNRLEIVNPEAERICWENDTRINNPFSLDAWRRIMLKPGDIFDLNEGWGFEEDKKVIAGCRYSKCDCASNDECFEYEKVLRLVPLTVKEENEMTLKEESDLISSHKFAAVKEEAGESQSETVESQEDLWDEVIDLTDETSRGYAIRTLQERFTIQRKKTMSKDKDEQEKINKWEPDRISPGTTPILEVPSVWFPFEGSEVLKVDPKEASEQSQTEIETIAINALRSIDMAEDVADPPFKAKDLAAMARAALEKIYNIQQKKEVDPLAGHGQPFEEYSTPKK